MKLLSLKLVQWRSFERCELDFPDGLIGVVGQNGSGKTTLAEAIGWALFGKLRPGSKASDVRRQGANGERSMVELVFRLGDVVYRVERVVGGAAKLWIGDAEEPETAAIRATNARLVRELDMRWETFQRTVFARQKDVAALDPSGTSDARRRHVERLLGLERYRFAAERARARAKELDAELRGLRDGAPDLNDLRAQCEQAAETAAGSDPAVLQAEAELSAARETVVGLEQQLDDARKLETRHAQLSQQHERAERAANQLAEQLKARRRQAAERAVKSEKLAALDGRRDDADVLATLRRAWDELSDCDAALREATAQTPEVSFDPEAAATKRERLIDVRAELDDLHRSPPPSMVRLSERVNALELAQGARPVEGAQRQLAEVEQRRDAAHQRMAVIERDIGRDEEHLADIARSGPDAECPVCLRPYGGDLDRILEEHRRRVEDNRGSLAELREALAELDRDRADASSVYDAARRAAEAMAQSSGPDDLEAARGALEAARQAADERDARLDELDRVKRELEPALDTDREAERLTAEHRARLAERRTRVEVAVAAVGVEAYDAAAHDEARRLHEEAEAARRLRLELNAAIDASADVDEQVAQLDKSLAEAATERDTAHAEIEGLAFDPGSVPELRAKLATEASLKDGAAERLGAARSSAQARDERVEELRARVAEAEAAHARIAEREREVREHNVAASILTDFRTAQNERAWPRLEEGASALLSETTDGRYADVRLSNDYDFVIVDRGEEHGLERYSGGEQDLANLCLRLAIADWVARERGVEIGFVMLDEVFGSQDSERRRRLIDELRTLGNRFHQLFVITHVPDIADLCEHQIQAELAEPGRSVAELAAG